MLEALNPLILAFGDIGKPEKVKLYADRLATFSPSVLAAGVNIVLDTYDKRAFPSIADILKACREAGDSRKPSPTEAVNHVQWLKERDDQVRTGMERMFDRFRLGQMWTEAQRDGWSLPLRGFVLEAAQVVYQRKLGMIVGYDQHRLLNAAFVSGSGRPDAIQVITGRREGYLRELTTLAAQSDPAITVPTELVAEWKSRAERKKAKS